MKLIERIEKTELGHRILRDPVFRLFITASVSMGWNAIYAIFNGVMGMIGGCMNINGLRDCGAAVTGTVHARHVWGCR